MIQTYCHPPELLRSIDFTLTVAGEKVEVFRTLRSAFALFEMTDGTVSATVEIAVAEDSVLTQEDVVVRPLRLGIQPEIDGNRVRFPLPPGQKVAVEIAKMPSLFLWPNLPEENPPAEGQPGVRFYAAGKVYEEGVITMADDETLYIEAGAVVRGRIHTKGRSNLRVCGRGIFDGSYYPRSEGHMLPSLFFERCKRVRIEDITMIHPSGWMIVPGACEDVEIRNVKEIGEESCSDGVDVVGSRNVHIHDCFFRNNDDNIAIKAFFLGSNNLTDVEADLRECPENILVENCIFGNGPAGNALEIGHELTVDTVRNVRFRNLDILYVHGTGAVFAIHNGDRATVEDVTFENIRVEHCYDKLIDLRIIKSMYNTDPDRGRIRNVTLRNIHWIPQRCNPGYTLSIIGGWDAEHTIENVTLENFCIDGKPIQSIDELEVFTRHAHNIRVTG